MGVGLFPQAVVLGISVAAPVGPMAVLCIRRTLADGQLSGLVTGMGIATADAFYGCLAGLGMKVVSDLLLGYRAWLQLLGGIFLCYLGVSAILSPPARKAAAGQRVSLPGAYGSALALTLANPMTILTFAAIFAGLGVAQGGGGYASSALVVLGVFLGSASWWLLLTTAVGVVRGRLPEGVLRWTNRASGGVLLAFGLFALSGFAASAL